MGFYPGGSSGSGPQKRYLTNSSTQAAFSLHSAVQRVALASGTDGLIISGSDHHRIITMTQQRGLRLTPFGKGADTATFDWKLWLAQFEFNSSGKPAFAQLRLAVSGSVALASALSRPTNSALFAASEIRGDVLTFTVQDAWTQINNANGGLLAPKAHSPNDDKGDAFLVIPDVYDHDGVLLEMDLTGATEANWVYELTR